MADDQVGFEIRGRFYPSPQMFRGGDGLLITELTGVDFDRWLERLQSDEDEDEGLSYVLLAGLVAVGIWQKHPGWRRDKVVKYFETLDLQTLAWVGSEVDDDGPPDETPAESQAGENNSSTPSESSTTTPDSSSDEPNPKPSGDPGSDTGSDSDPAT